MTATMLAARMHRVGEPFRIEEVPVPTVGPGEVLLRTLRAGLNHGDRHMRDGDLALRPGAGTDMLPDLPMVVGHDGLGEVVETGPDVAGWTTGDRAVVMCSLTCGFCKYCRSARQHLCPAHRVMGFLTVFGSEEGGRFSRYKDGLWAEYCRVPVTNLARLQPDDDIEQMSRVSQIGVGYRALKRARFTVGETVLVNGASGITGVGVVLSALAMGASHVIGVARNAARLERLRAIEPARISAIALDHGVSIRERVLDLTDGHGCQVLADLTPSGVETTVECVSSLEPGGRVVLIGGNTEMLSLSYRMMMIRSIEVTSFSGRFYADIPDLLELARRGMIDTRHIGSRHYPIERVNDAVDAMVLRGDDDPVWPMYAPDPAVGHHGG